MRKLGAIIAAALLAMLGFIIPASANAAIQPTICHPNGGCIAGESFSKDAYVIGTKATFDFDVSGKVHAGWPFSKTRADKKYAGHTVVWIHQTALPAGNCMGPDTNGDLFDEAIEPCAKAIAVVESGHWLIDVEATDDTPGLVIQLISAGHVRGRIVWGYHESSTQSSSWNY